MLPLRLAKPAKAPIRILCLGAHSDDIEIGCGGTILSLSERFPDCKFHWVVFSAAGVRAHEARRGALLFGGPSAGKQLMVKRFKDGFFPYRGAEVKAVFEGLKKSVCPDLIFTHNRKDAHQDHRTLAQLTWNTFRDHLILEYEIPKYDGDLGNPSVFVPLTAEVCDKKVDGILDTFQSQKAKQWFQRETFLSLMRLRGMECNAPSGYAEAFFCRKLVL